MKDQEILNQVYLGLHLEPAELERADQLIKMLMNELKRRIK